MAADFSVAEHVLAVRVVPFPVRLAARFAGAGSAEFRPVLNAGVSLTAAVAIRACAATTKVA